jgi:D-glycero-D-manno-heptose 1,7-bisphosphate phosphatase
MTSGTEFTRSKAVFVDRDGVLNDMVYDPTHGLLDSPRWPEQVRMRPGAGRFLGALKELGYRVVVVTNQPGIAKGTLSPDGLEAVNQRLYRLLEADGAGWDNIFVCPHHPGGPGMAANRHVCDCECRKPKPGLLLTAAEELRLDLKSSWMIGDGLNDLQAGHAAGCRAILMTQLKIEQVEMFFRLDHCMPDAVAVSFVDALAAISAGG